MNYVTLPNLASLKNELGVGVRIKPDNEKRRVLPSEFIRSWPFFLIHVLALGVFFIPFEWKWVGICVGLYYLRMFGITGGYHRYFSHKTYKTSRAFQFVLAFLGGTATQKSAMWWASHHRIHHRYSDSPGDVHSPIQDGFFWSHMGWMLAEDTEVIHWDQIPDLKKFPELVWLSRFHLVPPTVFGVATFLLWGWPGFFWGFCFGTLLLWHATFTINSLSHIFGSQRYKTGDTSKNNFFLSLLTMGEGWHNNHHCYQASVNQGFYWWELDLSFYVLKTFSWLGLVWDLKKPPLHLLAAKRWDALVPPQMGAAGAVSSIASPFNSAALTQSSKPGLPSPRRQIPTEHHVN